MTRVERGNVVLHVNDHEVSHYLQMGYNVTDETGKVLKSANPNDVHTLRQAYIEHTTKIAELEADIAEKDKQITELMAELEELAAKKGRSRSRKKDEDVIVPETTGEEASDTIHEDI